MAAPGRHRQKMEGILKTTSSRAIRTRSRAWIGVTATSAAALFAFAPAYAQQVAQTDAAVDEIVVTGTRIVRDGYQAPTPTTVVGIEQLEQAAAPSLIEYLNTVPTFSGNYSPASANQNSSGNPGTASANLRNLGTGRTLILINGQRSVGSNSAGLVDISAIPEQLISRVDVVTGGASSAYGSDAVAGVVNFVLDTKFTGIKGELSGGITNYGDDKNFKVALTSGTPFAGGRGHFLVSGNITRNDGILTADREWNLEGWQIMTNPTYTATNGQPQNLLLNSVSPGTSSPGGIIISGPLKGVAFGRGGTPYQFNYGSTFAPGLMQGGEWKTNQARPLLSASLEPRLSRHNVFARLSYQLGENVEVFAQSNWSHVNSLTYAYGNTFFGGINVSALHPYLPASVAAQASAAGVSMITMGTLNLDMGRNGLLNDRHTLRHVIGANGTFDAFDSNWTWDAYYQLGVSRNSNRVVDTRDTINYNKAIDSVRGANGSVICRVNADADASNDDSACVPYNPFGFDVNSDAALDYVLGNAYRFLRTKQEVFAASISGDFFSTWAGPVSVATGAEHRRESSNGFVSARDLLNTYYAGNYRATIGRYHVTEGFFETVVPLARDQDWAQSLDLNGAVRATDYSSAGYVTTWKLGLTYSPVADITFRATRSRDIRAPNLDDLFNAGTTSTNNVIDPRTGSSVNYLGTTRGNPDLVPEKADTTGLGVVLQPSFLAGFSAAVDYWNIDLKGAITTVTAQNTVDLCFQGNQAFCQAINNGGPLISTGSSFDNRIFVQPFNLAQREVRGIDFEASYQLPLSEIDESWGGNLTLRTLATHYLKNYQDNRLTPPTDTVGELADDGPPNWRWQTSLSYQNEAISATFVARGVSSGVYNNAWIECTTGCPTSTVANPTINYNRIEGATYFDLSLSYDFLMGDDGETTIQTFFNVKNLFNSDPKIVAGRGNFASDIVISNPVFFDQNGRIFRAGVRFRM